MGIGIMFHVAIAIYVASFLMFFRFVSRHALAMYCTHTIDNELVDGKRRDRNEVRLFLQNLEEQALEQGPFCLTIELQPHSPIDRTLVCAGPKTFYREASNLQRGIFQVHFESLPPLDTWLFKVETVHEECKIRVALETSDLIIVDDKPTGRSDPAEQPSALLRPSRRLASLTLNSRDKRSVVSGSYVTPSRRAALWLTLLAIVGYLLLVLAYQASPCAAGADLWRCGWKQLSFVDLLACIGLCVATVVWMVFGRRKPFPIAQGYLECSESKDFEWSNLPLVKRPADAPPRAKPADASDDDDVFDNATG